MKLLIQNVIIADPRSALNGKKSDLLIIDGQIAEITTSGSLKANDAEVLNADGGFASPGWFDMRVNFREPGEEQKETILSGQNAAAAGGFTGVLMMPSVKPAVSTRSGVEYIRSKSAGHLVDVIPSGSITVERAGKELAEMFDMMLGGAPVFTDDKRYIENTGLMLRAMQYAGNINARLIAYAEDTSLAGSNTANESAVTTLLGMKGAAAISEVIAIERDLNLVRYSGLPLHFAGISSREAVEAIRSAKMEGLPVTAEVFIYHLVFDDSSLESFDSNFKVKPPLRGIHDVEILREAVLDGTIDVISSDHSPQDPESKMVEFDYAAFGMSSLETVYPALRSAFGNELNETRIAELMSINPRGLLGIQIPRIQQNEQANITIFHPDLNWNYSRANMQSKSVNSPYFNQDMKGRVIAVVNNGRYNVIRL